jgi:hypothetical protein
VFFDSAAVQTLADRPWLDETAQLEACLRGAYIARLPREGSWDLTRPWAEVASQVDRVPTMPAMTLALLGVSVTVAVRLPWIATLHGFVVVGADLVGLAPHENGVNRFQRAS